MSPVRITQMMMVSAVLAGCVEAAATRETTQAVASCAEEDESYNCRCAGCGANGLNQNSWNALFAEADRNALDTVGAWDWTADGPVSLCKPSTVHPNDPGDQDCDLALAWSRWIGGNGKHAAMMTSFVKVIAPKTYGVHDGTDVYYGEFGLAPNVLRASWSYADQEIVTGGMLALLDAVHDVPVCLTTERNPDNCATAGNSYHESTTFGNTFRMHYAGISGGADASEPIHNPRYGTVRSDSASVFNWGDGHCHTTGWGLHTLASDCTDYRGITWQWPVVIVTPFLPRRWYYNNTTDPQTRPTGIPPVR